MIHSQNQSNIDCVHFYKDKYSSSQLKIFFIGEISFGPSEISFLLSKICLDTTRFHLTKSKFFFNDAHYFCPAGMEFQCEISPTLEQ